MKNWWLYVLRLEGEKYYVGITSKTPEERFKEHKNGFLAANWTTKYKPLEIIQTKNLGQIDKERAEKFENKVTREYIKKYGIKNVRGGDISATDDLIKRFGYYFTSWDWEVLTTVLFLMLIIFVLLLALFF